MNRATLTLDMDRACSECGTRGVGKNGKCLSCTATALGIAGESLDVTTTEVTVKLTAGDMTSLRKALAAVEAEIGETLTTDGFTATLKLKTPFNVTPQVNNIKSLFRAHRGVKAEVSTKATTKDIESIDSESPTWENTPMGQLLRDA